MLGPANCLPQKKEHLNLRIQERLVLLPKPMRAADTSRAAGWAPTPGPAWTRSARTDARSAQTR
jgi:hypothetical protein